MSYPDPAAAPTDPTDRRPGTVTVAATVLLVMAVAAIGSAVVTLVGLPGVVDRFRSDVGTAAGPDEVGAAVTLVRAVVWSSALLTVLVSILLVGLAVGLRAGRPGARTAVWVVGGLGLVGGCCSVAVLVGQRVVPLPVDSDRPADAVLLAAVSDAYPAWWLPLNAGLSVGQVLGYLLAVALLATPAARRFLRRR